MPSICSQSLVVVRTVPSVLAFLVGWSESGQRPQFDFVGGVSTGSLLATHALLGTPADDLILEEMYTQITDEDIFESRPLIGLLKSDSLRDTAPLQALIAKYITAETLERVAAAADDNRLIMAGTTNIDYGQTWVWNLSLIAKDGDLDLYRKVLLASASFPILFPPVEIDGHLFVDGAARSNVIVIGHAVDRTNRQPASVRSRQCLSDLQRQVSASSPRRYSRAFLAASLVQLSVGVMMDQSMQTAH